MSGPELLHPVPRFPEQEPEVFREVREMSPTAIKGQWSWEGVPLCESAAAQSYSCSRAGDTHPGGLGGSLSPVP